MAEFEGDFSGLERLIEKLEGADDALIGRAGERAAEALEERLEDQYERGVDPSNAPWAPVSAATLRARKKKKTPPPLTDTADMRGHSKAVSGVRGITVRIDRPSGDPRVPAEMQKTRPIVPEGGSDLPEPWDRAVRDAIDSEIDEHFG